MDFVQEKKKGSESRTLKAGLATSMIVPSKSNLAKSKKKKVDVEIHSSIRSDHEGFFSLILLLPSDLSFDQLLGCPIDGLAEVNVNRFGKKKKKEKVEEVNKRCQKIRMKLPISHSMPWPFRSSNKDSHPFQGKRRCMPL